MSRSSMPCQRRSAQEVASSRKEGNRRQADWRRERDVSQPQSPLPQCLEVTDLPRFRWVVCQLAELRKCLKLPNVRKELTSLPKTLDATYARILSTVPQMYQREMQTLLMFLAFSERPMTIQEVAEATAVNLETQRFDPDERFASAYDLLEFCSSLVSLSELRVHSSQIW